MTSTNWNEEAIAEGLHRRGNAERLTTYLKDPLVEIMNPLLRGGEILPPESIDVMMVLIFIHINLLGYLHSGKAETSDAVAFLRKYLGMVDPKYEEVGGLLYDLLRHGWLHRFVPKRLKLDNGMILDFQYTNNMNREQHLIMVEIQGAKKLQISVSLLYEDLLSAIALFADDIRHNQNVSKVFEDAFKERRKPEEESNLRRKYNQDLEFIYRLLK